MCDVIIGATHDRVSLLNLQAIAFSFIDADLQRENADTVAQKAWCVGTLNVAGNLTVTGDFTVSGTTTTIDTDNLAIEDLNITLANGEANSAVADGAGITMVGARQSGEELGRTDIEHLDFLFGFSLLCFC